MGARRWPVGAFFISQTIETLLVFGLLWLFTLGPAYSLGVLWDPYLPVWVPFGGALGGALISLVGVVEHTIDWDSPRYAYWHLLRPLLGLVSGSVAVIIVLFVLKGIFPDVIPKEGTPYTPSGMFIMFVIAFVVGYREETFRQLVKRVVDVILGPGDAAATSKVTIVPSLTRLTAKLDNSPVTATMTLFNGTKDTFSLQNVLSWVPADVLTATIDDPATPLGPSEQRTINVTWTPGAPPKAITGTVTVQVGGHAVSANIEGLLP